MRALAAVYRGVIESEEALLGFERSPPVRVLGRSSWAPDCDSDYCDRCGATRQPLGGSCSSCVDRRFPYDRVVRLGAYRAPLSDWICEVKFARWQAMGHVLGQALGRRVLARCVHGSLRTELIVPIPMPKVRRVVRGIDHAQVIASGVAEELALPIRRPLYQAGGRTQVSRTPSERERRRSPFKPRRFARGLAGETVLLLDDVLTSGRTARAAARAVRRIGASKVILAVLAVTEHT